MAFTFIFLYFAAKLQFYTLFYKTQKTMKKILTLCAAAVMAGSAAAQTVDESKFLDNWYVGVNVGASVKTTHTAWFKNLNPEAGVRVGKWFTPVYGVAAEADFYFRNRPYPNSGTFIRATNVNLLGTINATNLFLGYKGEPRVFEVIPVAGIGALHSFNAHGGKNVNTFRTKVGVDFAFNLGEKKAWQVYVEPSINWSLYNNYQPTDGMNFNINKSAMQLKVGVNYKFKGSNGSHNFTIAQVRDQSEIDGLNSQINSLRSNLNSKDSELAAAKQENANLKQALADCQKKTNEVKYVKPATATNLQPTVLFRQGKTTIDPAQYAPIELIANYMRKNKDAKVEIKGYASPEGSAEINARIAQQRADAVKNALINKYKISASRLKATGMGATDKLFEQVEFNRVATFNDMTKE